MQYKKRDLPRIFGPGIYSFDSSVFIGGSFRRSVGAESSSPVLSGFIINTLSGKGEK